MRRHYLTGFFLFAATLLQAGPLYVSPAGRHVPPFASWESAATNIQAAVDAAAPGGTVLVRSGVYTGAGDNVVSITHSLTLRGESGDPVDVPIDGQGTRRGILVTLTNEDASVTIEGLTVTNGYTGAEHGYGAGIYMDHTRVSAGTAEVRNCVIAGNINASPTRYNHGGGLASRGRAGSEFHTIVTGCLFSGNTVTNKDSMGGGAVFFNTRLTMEDCRVEANRAAGGTGTYIAGYGGGVSAMHVPTGSVIRSTSFRGNFARTSGSGGGGGIHVSGDTTDLMVEECVFADNESKFGADVMQPDGTLTLRKCRMAGERGSKAIKAIYLGWAKSMPTTRVIDCAIDGGIRSIKQGKKGDFVMIDNSWRGSKRDPAVIIDEHGAVRPVRTLDDWKSRRADILREVEQVAGPLPDKSLFPAPELKVLQDDIIDGQLRRQKIEYFSDSKASPRIKAWLLSPTANSCMEAGDPAAKKLAAVLCIHQTTPLGKDEPAGLDGNTNMFYAIELAQRGFITLAPDSVSFGEYMDFTKFTNNFVSATMKSVVDHIRAVDILCGLPGVDPERIGCIGHSLGGFNTIFVSLFEPRIKAVVSSSGFVSWRGYAERFGDLRAWANPKVYMPSISSKYQNNPELMPFDLHEVIAALAPRPLFVNAPMKDYALVDNVRETLTAARPIYELYGAADAVRSTHPDCGHGFPPAVREKAYLFLERHLRENKEE